MPCYLDVDGRLVLDAHFSQGPRLAADDFLTYRVRVESRPAWRVRRCVWCLRGVNWTLGVANSTVGVEANTRVEADLHHLLGGLYESSTTTTTCHPRRAHTLPARAHRPVELFRGAGRADHDLMPTKGWASGAGFERTTAQRHFRRRVIIWIFWGSWMAVGWFRRVAHKGSACVK